MSDNEESGDNVLNGLSGGFDSSTDNDSKSHLTIEDNDKGRILQIVDTLNENFIFKTMQDTREIYYYHAVKGIFVKGGESLIESQCESICNSISTHEVSEVLNHIIRRTLTGREEFDRQIEWLACKNCMINLKTLEIKYHDPNFMVTLEKL